jgi:transposase
MRVYARSIQRPDKISDEQLEHLAERIRREQDTRSEIEAWQITRAAMQRWRWGSRPRVAS